MTIRGKHACIAASILLLMSIHLYGQTHYTFVSKTGNNMTVLVRTSINPNINGEPLATGDEIGVFNRAGDCVGAIVWSDTNTAITVWGDDDRTQTLDGIASGDTLRFHIWDASESRDIPATVTYVDAGHLTYVADRIAILQTLEAHSTGIADHRGCSITLNNDFDTGKRITIYDISGKAVMRYAGIPGNAAGMLRRAGTAGLPCGKYLAAIESKGTREFQIISLTR